VDKFTIKTGSRIGNPRRQNKQFNKPSKKAIIELHELSEFLFVQLV